MPLVLSWAKWARKLCVLHYYMITPGFDGLILLYLSSLYISWIWKHTVITWGSTLAYQGIISNWWLINWTVTIYQSQFCIPRYATELPHIICNESLLSVKRWFLTLYVMSHFYQSKCYIFVQLHAVACRLRSASQRLFKHLFIFVMLKLYFLSTMRTCHMLLSTFI